MKQGILVPGGKVNISARTWFLVILPLYTFFYMLLTVGAFQFDYPRATFFMAGLAPIVGNGLGAYRCFSLIRGWKVRGLVLVKGVYNAAFVLRGGLWMASAFTAHSHFRPTIPALINVSVTAFIIGILSGLGFMIWYDLRPVTDEELARGTGASILATRIDLRFWRGEGSE
jgi:hypothetical protein